MEASLFTLCSPEGCYKAIQYVLNSQLQAYSYPAFELSQSNGCVLQF